MLVHAPADMAGGVALPVAEGGEVGVEQGGVGTVALDADDVVVLDRQADRRLDEVVERQVEIAGGEHHRAVHAVGGGEGRHQPARPVGEGAGPAGEPDRAARGGAGEVHVQVGAGVGGDVHPPSGGDPFVAERDTAGKVVVPPQAFEHLRVLVGDHQHAGAATEDLAELWRVQCALDGAVDDEVAGGEAGDDGRVVGERLRGPGGADGHGVGGRGSGHDHVEHPPTEGLSSQAGSLHQHGPALALAEDGDRLALVQPAAGEVGGEGLDVAPFGGHSLASTVSRW